MKEIIFFALVMFFVFIGPFWVIIRKNNSLKKISKVKDKEIETLKKEKSELSSQIANYKELAEYWKNEYGMLH